MVNIECVKQKLGDEIMALDFNDDKPIYIQLGAMIEDIILTGNLKEG